MRRFLRLLGAACVFACAATAQAQQPSFEEVLASLKQSAAKLKEMPRAVEAPKPTEPSKPVKPMPKDAGPVMSAEYNRLMKAGKPFLVYVGGDARKVPGVPAVRDDAFPTKYTVCAVLVMDGSAYVLEDGTTAQDVRRWAGLEVRPGGDDPFDPSYKRVGQRSAQSDDRAGDLGRGPWLPDAEQAKIKAMWPEGVPFPATLKFYKLPRASQEVSVTNDQVNYNFHYASGDNVNLRYPYVGSGGFDFVEDGTARNVTGMAIPAGSRIKVWTQRKPVFAGSDRYGWLFGDNGFQREVSLFWAFPSDTQVFDVLIRKNADGTEHIFSVRRRTKPDGVWDDGSSFFPDVPIKRESVTWLDLTAKKNLATARNIFGMDQVTFTVAETEPIKGKPKFKGYKNTVGLTDGGHFTPPGFVGAGVTCNKCHGVVSLQTMMATHGEKSPYGGPALAGSDSVYSWYPVLQSQFGAYQPAMDNRWPIEVVSR
jgi:hypothetical protein